MDVNICNVHIIWQRRFTLWLSFLLSIALPNQNKVDPRKMKKVIPISMISYFGVFFNCIHFQNLKTFLESERASSTQYGYRKYEIRAQLFSPTLAHGNSKNEIRERNRTKKKENSEHRKKYSVRETETFQRICS